MTYFILCSECGFEDRTDWLDTHDICPRCGVPDTLELIAEGAEE